MFVAVQPAVVFPQPLGPRAVGALFDASVSRVCDAVLLGCVAWNQGCSPRGCLSDGRRAARLFKPVYRSSAIILHRHPQQIKQAPSKSQLSDMACDSLSWCKHAGCDYHSRRHLSQPLIVCPLTPVGRKFHCLQGKHRGATAHQRDGNGLVAFFLKERTGRDAPQTANKKGTSRNNAHMAHLPF